MKLVFQIVAGIAFAALLLTNPNAAIGVAFVLVPLVLAVKFLAWFAKPTSFPPDAEMLLRVAVEQGKQIALPLVGGGTKPARIVSYDKARLVAIDPATGETQRLSWSGIDSKKLISALL